MNVSAIIVLRVMCDLPVSPITFDSEWNHLSDIELADLKFGIPGKIDVLFGMNVFSNMLKQGRRLVLTSRTILDITLESVYT